MTNVTVGSLMTSPVHTLGPNDDLVAGVGMVMDGSFWETEIIGQTIWGGYAFPPQDWIDLSLHNVSEAGWILAGTGLGAGDVLPGAFNGFGTGTLIDFDVPGEPFPVDLHLSGTPADTLVWAVAPSDDARAWWLASDGEYWTWPSLAGHATPTISQPNHASARYIRCILPGTLTADRGRMHYRR